MRCGASGHDPVGVGVTYPERVFRRRTEDPPAAVPTGTDRPGAKGRPTPSRKEAEAARKAQLKPTLDKREARRQRRAEVARDRQRVRTAMAQGDESAYPLRDRGPVRRFVRDLVDSRRTVAEFMLPILLLVLLSSLVPSRQMQAITAFLWLFSMLLLISDTTLLGFRVKREVARRFPDENTKGSVFYGIARATQLRRLRMPKPAVRPGQPPRR